MTKEDMAAAAGGEGHTRGEAKKFTPLTTFFAGSTGLLLVLLVVAMARKPKAGEVQP